MSERPECRECPQASMRDYLAAQLADELRRMIAEPAPVLMAPSATTTLYRTGFFGGRASGLESALALVETMFGVEAADPGWVGATVPVDGP